MADAQIDEIHYPTGSLSSVEKQILDEYKKLAEKLSTLKHELTELNNKIDLQKAIDSATRATTTTDEKQEEAKKDFIVQLRALEQTLSMFGTLFKSSVYKIFINNEENIENGGLHNGDTENQL
ncbi:hypothetical protein BRETT_003299 [Brettanomyces bruxellensis]|uniref:DASH complex subunit DAD3 n=1 Tax=Dekkera bruxellensis TaxID=5007 RepID=A0A871RH92_DEKBR|nr:uncharacterized protein BRETT_003299 [Brettanomyces bruxellensis]QOU23108.1 hypothetical protein BRETT_003299 [Brettanomyces bruxellensis]